MTDTATTQTPAPAAPAAGTPEHDAAMAAVFDQRQQSETQSNQAAPAAGAPVPDWVPEKFRTAEDPMKAMAEAYSALEAKQSAPKETPPAETPKTAEEAAAALEGTGIDYDGLAAKFEQTGALEASDYDALAKAGIPREAVDAFIEGQEAVAEGIRLNVFQTIGGQDNFEAMANWARTSVPKAELVAFNSVMDGGNVDQIKLAVSGLYSRYTAANGKEPNLLGGGNQASHGDVFRSTAEFTAALRDARYATDPAYRADVEAKLSRSNIM